MTLAAAAALLPRLFSPEHADEIYARPTGDRRGTRDHFLRKRRDMLNAVLATSTRAKSAAGSSVGASGSAAASVMGPS